MKNLKYILLALLLITTFFSCYNDKGNYDYLSDEEVGTIKIDTIGIANRMAFSKNYSPGDTIHFEPNVKYSHPERLAYRWFYLTLNNYTYQAVQVGNSMVYPPADTLAHTKKLDYIINLEAGQYKFYFMAKDTVTGQVAYLEPSNYTSVAIKGSQGGLYLLSEYNGQTDIDVFTSDLMLIYGSNAQYKHYYSGSTGKMLPGKPVFIRGCSTGSASKNGYMVATDQTMTRFNSVGMQTMDNWDKMFFTPPSTYSPQNFCFVNKAEFFINNGKIHVLYTNKANNRKLSAPIAGDYQAADFLSHETKASWGAVTGAIGADQVIYDKKNHCFRPYFAYQSSVGSFKSTSGDAVIDANKLPANPIGIFSGYNERTYCVVPDSGTYYLYRFQFYNRVDNGNLSADGAYSKTNLSGCTDIGKAKYFTANSGGHAFFYATDNAVYSFSPSSGQKTSYTFYTCPSDEKVTCIWTWNGGGWPTMCVAFWIATWNETTKEGKLLEYEIDNNAGTPRAMWGPMFGSTNPNPYITTGWGKIVSMTCSDAE